ncbi:MAG: hypothetical protein PHX13_09060 [Thiovulaceae bacterium]|nr:hypothetical protein [Sulfurimonadaceae bacterium]
MKIFLLVTLLSTFLFADSMCGVKADTNTSKKEEIKCRCVCDKKLSREEKMAEALEFYKNSKIYKFSKYNFLN